MKWKYLSNTIIEESEYVPLTHEERGSLRDWLNRLLLNKILRNLNCNILLVLTYWVLRLPSVSIVAVLKQRVNLIHQSCFSDLFTSFIPLKKFLVFQLQKLVRKNYNWLHHHANHINKGEKKNDIHGSTITSKQDELISHAFGKGKL